MIESRASNLKLRHEFIERDNFERVPYGYRFPEYETHQATKLDAWLDFADALPSVWMKSSATLSGMSGGGEPDRCLLSGCLPAR